LRRYAIIGSGVAGIAAAEAIRSQDSTGEILIIGEEQAGYYSRPGLAYYITGELSEDQLLPYTSEDFDQLKAKRLQTYATRILPRQHRLELHNSSMVTYDRLLIATGASAATMSTPGMDLQGVVKLDNLNDARRIIKLARKARSGVVVGGGITALEIVEGLLARGVKTNYFLRGDRYWSNVLDEIESRIVEDRLKEEGVTIHYHTELEEILGKRSQVIGVRTKDGRQIKCNLVAIAIGIRPRVELAKAAGIDTDRGILVDEYMHSSATDVFAAGDVAQVFDPFTGKSLIDSLWGPAREQGTTAGLNMAGIAKPYLRTIPFNVTRLGNLTTTIIGTVGSGSDDDLIGIIRGDSETWRQLPDAIAAQSDFDINRLRVMVGRDTILGAIVMGDQTLSKPLHQLVSKQVDISLIREQLLQPNAPLADILADFYTQWMKEYAISTRQS
jgi:NAD(P)H-nitrite reductase large subunit